MTLLKTLSLASLLCIPCAGQTAAAPGPDISAWYRLPGVVYPTDPKTKAAVYPYKWLRLDPGLTMVEDANKTPHLVLGIPFSLNGKLIGNIRGLNLVGGPGVILDTIIDNNGTATATLQISLMAGCTVDANGSGTLCPGTTAPPMPLPQQAVVVVHEMPVQQADGTWTVVGIPTDQGVACFKANVYQVPGTDYTIQGNIITSKWTVADAVYCQYKYFAAAAPAQSVPPK